MTHSHSSCSSALGNPKSFRIAPKLIHRLGTCAAVLASAWSAAAAVFDVVEDYSLSNPSGVWSYGYGYGYGDWGGLLTEPGSNGQYEWWSIGTYPYVQRNVSGAPDIGPWYFIPTDALCVVPANSLCAIVRFTAPAAGSYDFNGAFTQLEDHTWVTSWEGAVVTSEQTSWTAFSGNLGGPGWLGKSIPFQFAADLLSGDTVDFVVSANGTNWGDDTGLQVRVVSPVPEPAALGLAVGASLIASTVTLRRWRRRRQGTGAAV